MRDVLKEIGLLPVNVYLNTLETHMLPVVLNVWLIQTAPQTKLVRETNVLILVLEHVGSMPNVMLEIIFPCVHVYQDMKGIPLSPVGSDLKVIFLSNNWIDMVFLL